MKCVDVVRLVAALTLPAVLSACANFTQAGPGPDPFLKSRQQLEVLLPPLERFRQIYLDDFASCGKLAICSAGSKPNYVDLPMGTSVDRTFAYAYQMCYLKLECDRKEGDEVEECKKQCQ